MERWQRELEEDWENEEHDEKMYANNPPYNIDELTKEDEEKCIKEDWIRIIIRRTNCFRSSKIVTTRSIE